MKSYALRLTVLAVLVLTVAWTAPILAEDPAPAAPTANATPSEDCGEPLFSQEPNQSRQGLEVPAVDGMTPEPIPTHGWDCEPVQTECRSCTYGVKACDVQWCFHYDGLWHKHTRWCSSCGSFC